MVCNPKGVSPTMDLRLFYFFGGNENGKQRNILSWKRKYRKTYGKICNTLYNMVL